MIIKYINNTLTINEQLLDRLNNINFSDDLCSYMTEIIIIFILRKFKDKILNEVYKKNVSRF